MKHGNERSMRSPQSRRRQPADDHGFTAVVCHGPTCGRHNGEATVGGLRACVRGHRHGVLVAASCLLGRVSCHAFTTSSTHRPTGSLLVVQPCSADRAPVGPALRIGPLANPEDVATVCSWLDSGDLHTTALPAHLRFRAALAGRGTNN